MTTEQDNLEIAEDVDAVKQATLENNDDKGLVEESQLAGADQSDGLAAPLEGNDEKGNNLVEESQLASADHGDGLDAPLDNNDDEGNTLVEDLAGADQSAGLNADLAADQATIIEDSHVKIKDKVVTIDPAESKKLNVDDEASLMTTIKSSETIGKVSGGEALPNADDLDLKVGLDLNVDLVGEEDDVVSVDSLPPDLDYLLQKNVSTVQTFFTFMEGLPSISEMELTPEEEEENMQRLTVESEVERKELYGSFVNPLTGDELSSSESTSDSDFDEEDVHGEGEETKMSSDAEDWLSIASIKSIDDKKTAIDDEEDDVVLKMVPHVSIVDDVDLDQLRREKMLAQQLELKQSIERFVDNLIKTAVDVVEFVDPKKILIASLDKVKMLKKMLDDVINIEVERQKNRVLNLRTVEYYYKKKMFRTISSDASQNWSRTFWPYIEVLNKLDTALHKEHNVIETQNSLAEIENRELKELELFVSDKEREYEDVVHNTIVKVNSPSKWKQHVDNSLQKLAAERNKISKERISVIKLQHTIADLTETLKRTEFVTPEYTMTDYERLSAHIMKLGDINDEIIQSINKTTIQYRNILHLLAHIREKRHIVFCQTRYDNKVYRGIKRNHHKLCERLHRSKIIHSTLGMKLSDLSWSAGLLDKPSLMRDYDNTIDTIKELKNIQQKLKDEFSRLSIRRSTCR